MKRPKKIIKKTIKRAGGFDNWCRIKNLSYSKQGIFYFADGRIKTNNTQQHNYKFYPQISAEIGWKENDVNHHIF